MPSLTGRRGPRGPVICIRRAMRRANLVGAASLHCACGRGRLHGPSVASPWTHLRCSGSGLCARRGASLIGATSLGSSCSATCPPISPRLAAELTCLSCRGISASSANQQTRSISRSPFSAVLSCVLGRSGRPKEPKLFGGRFVVGRDEKTDCGAVPGSCCCCSTWFRVTSHE